MTVETLVTIIGVVLAVLTIMPRTSRLELLLRLRSRDVVLLGAAILAAHYFLFYDYFRDLGWTARVRPVWSHASPSDAAYVVVMGVISLVGFDMWWFRLTPSKLRRFRALVDELVWSEGYTQAFLLVERHLPQLVRIATRQPWWARLRVSWHPTGRLAESFGVPRRRPNRFQGWVASRLPAQDTAAAAALDVFRILLTSPAAVETLAHQRPYTGLPFVRLQYALIPGAEFRDLFLRALLRTPGSIWYAELRNVTGMVSPHRYEIPPENRLLHALLANAAFAESTNIYRPIGEFVIDDLNRRYRSQDDDLNHSSADFQEVRAAESPVWTAIYFFDLMVREALWQGIAWHMWLYYFPTFADRIVRNYDDKADRLASRDDEWPTAYAFLLYEIVRTLCDWVRALERVPPEQENVRLKRADLENENGNIPKSALLALGECYWHVLPSEKLPLRFRRSLLDSAFDLYFWLRDQTGLEDYARVLALSLRDGGSWLLAENRRALTAFVRDALLAADRTHFPTDQLKELLAILETPGS